jgi:hypothetical protein
MYHMSSWTVKKKPSSFGFIYLNKLIHKNHGIYNKCNLYKENDIYNLFGIIKLLIPAVPDLDEARP